MRLEVEPKSLYGRDGGADFTDTLILSGSFIGFRDEFKKSIGCKDKFRVLYAELQYPSTKANQCAPRPMPPPSSPQMRLILLLIAL